MFVKLYRYGSKEIHWHSDFDEVEDEEREMYDTGILINAETAIDTIRTEPFVIAKSVYEDEKYHNIRLHYSQLPDETYISHADFLKIINAKNS